MNTLSPMDLAMLHAYLDGELGTAERAAFEARLVNETTLGGAVEAERRFRTHLRIRLTQTHAPASLYTRVQTTLGPQKPLSSPWQGFLSWLSTPQPIRPAVGVIYSLLWLVILGGIIWWLGQPAAKNNLAFRELADIHTIYFEHNSVFDVTGPPADITAWFQNRVSFLVAAPHLTGWQLAGARLGEFQQQGTAHLLYEQPDGQRVSLTFFAPHQTNFPAEAGVRFAAQTFYVGDNGQHRAIVWRSGDMGYALVGDAQLPIENLLTLAADLRAQLH